jgi:hypothetical protein
MRKVSKRGKEVGRRSAGEKGAKKGGESREENEPLSKRHSVGRKDGRVAMNED